MEACIHEESFHSVLVSI